MAPLILCYHAVSADWPAALSVRPTALREQLELLLERGYQGATVSAALREPAAPPTVAVTFDDAFRSVAELALPILSDLGLPGTVYVPTKFPDSRRPLSWPGIDGWLGGRHRAELQPLGWDELRALGGEGWEIGSHTCSHPHLTHLDDDALERELVDSRDAVAGELGRCESLAYPYGEVDERVAAGARAAGYENAMALDPRSRRSVDHMRPRVGVYRNDDRRRFALKVSPALRAVRASPLWVAVQAARDARRKGSAAILSAGHSLGANSTGEVPVAIGAEFAGLV